MTLPAFVPVKNSNGEIQRVPSRWLDHPILGKGFTLTPSMRKAAEQAATEGRQIEDPAHTNAIDTGVAPDSGTAPEPTTSPTTRTRTRRATKEA